MDAMFSMIIVLVKTYTIRDYGLYNIDLKVTDDIVSQLIHLRKLDLYGCNKMYG